jgi:hypothetical protein
LTQTDISLLAPTDEALHHFAFSLKQEKVRYIMSVKP